MNVGSWRDVLETTRNVPAETDLDRIEEIAQERPSLIHSDPLKSISSRRLTCGYDINTNASAKGIDRFCRRVLAIAEMTPDDWSVILE